MDWTDLLFPRTCPCCGGELREGQTVCDHCAPGIHVNPSPQCPYCGVSLRSCHCAKNPRSYDRIVAPFFYEGSIREALLRMKFGKHEDVARYPSTKTWPGTSHRNCGRRSTPGTSERPSTS